MEKTKTNIMLDREFTHSRDVLSAKRKDLKGKGYGNRSEVHEGHLITGFFPGV
jgi:hypothetical protein